MLTFIPGKNTLNFILLLILAEEKVRVYNIIYIDVIHCCLMTLQLQKCASVKVNKSELDELATPDLHTDAKG